MIKKKYPNAFKLMEEFHRDNGTGGLPTWPDWCYAPISGAIAIVTEGADFNPLQLLGVMADAQGIAALAPWRQSKEVYVLDPDMEQLLSEQDDDHIPSEALLNLPYPGFYVQCNDLRIEDRVFDGFFVHLEYDPERQDQELRLLLLDDDYQTLAVPIHIDEQDIGDNLNRIYQIGLENAADYPELRQMLIKAQNQSESVRTLHAAHQKMLQIVLYLCSQNAEIAPNSQQMLTRRPAAGSRVKDRYAEIRKWDVGVRIGNAYRKYKSTHRDVTEPQETPSDKPQRQSPRPHMRRGHFRHTVVGKRKGVPQGQREYKLSWIAPTFVGAAGDEELPAVIHLVKE